MYPPNHYPPQHYGAQAQPGMPMLPSNVSPQFQQFVPLINQHAVQEVVNSSSRTPLRGAYAQALQQNNWNNPRFQQLVHAVGQYGEFIAATRNVAPPQAIQAAASEVVSVLTAVFASENRQQFSQLLSDPAAADQINKLLAQYQEMDRQITSFYSRGAGMQMPQMGHPQMGHQMPPMQGYPQHYTNPYGNQPMGGMYAPMRSGYQPAGMAGPGPAPNPLLVNRATSIGHQPMGYQAQPQVSNPLLKRAATEPPKAVNMIESLHMSPPAQQQQRQQTPVTIQPEDVQPLNLNQPLSAPPPPPAPVPAPPAVPPQPEIPDAGWNSYGSTEWPKVRDLTRPWDAMLTRDGTEMRYAGTSGWSITTDEDNPYPKAYNPETHVKMHVRHADGMITETIVEKDETMNYLEHELDSKMRTRYDATARRDENVAVDLGLLSRLRPVPEQPISTVKEEEVKTEGVEEIVDDTPIQTLDTTILVSELSHARTKLKIALKKAGVNTESPFEYYVDEVTPVLVGEADAARARELTTQCSTPKELALKISEIEDQELRTLLDRRMTDAINHALQNNMGLKGWAMDSFLGDYKALIDALAQDYSEGLVIQFNTYFDNLCSAACAVVEDERTVSFALNKLGLALEEVEETQMQVLAFVTRHSVTRLPWQLRDLKVVLDQDRPSLVSESQLPKLHEALNSVLLRTVDLPLVYANRYLLTSDDRVLEIHQGYLAADAILLGHSTRKASDF